MDDPREIGTIIGSVFWAFISILGIIKCFRIAPRKTTSAICVHSLTLFLFAYLLMQIFNFVKAFFPDGLLETLGLFVLGVGGFVLFVVSIMLAVIGLILYGRSFNPDGTRREFVQGKKQAVWAIVLSAIFISIFILGLIIGLISKDQVGLIDQALNRSNQSEFIFTDKNFYLSLPENHSWVEMNTEELNPESSIMMMRKDPQAYLTIIAEQIGVETAMSNEQLAEIAQANVKAVALDPVFSDIKPYTVSGQKGLLYKVDATVGSFDASYITWCFATNGYCYQIIFWSGRADKEELSVLAADVLHGFKQIDSSKRFYSAGSTPFGRKESAFFGYAVDLQETDWLAWDNLHETDKLSDSGGIHHSGARFCITPMVIPVDDVSLEVLHEAFLLLYEFDGPLMEDQVESIQSQGMSGLAYSYSNAENKCIEQVLISSNCAYLVSVWCPLSQSDGLEERATEVFESVTFTPSKGTLPKLSEEAPDRQVAQGLMLNKVGLGYYNTGRYLIALDWFRSGLSCDTTNATYFGNILAAHAQLNKNEEGIAYFEAASPKLKEASQVRSWYATLLAGAGKVAEADAIYTELFKPGYRDDDDFMAWTQLRADNGLWENLDKLFADYYNGKPSTALKVHQLSIYYSKGDYERVAELARSFLSQQGFSPEVAHWLIDATQEMGLYNESLEVCENLLDKGYESVGVYQEKAVNEYYLKWYRQAKTSLEAALVLNPRNENTLEWLAAVSAELGEGDNSGLKEFIEPVVLPDVFSDVLSGAPDEDFGAEFGAYYTRRLILWHYEEGHVLKRTDIRRIQVLDNAGVVAFSSLEYSYNPVSQNIFVNELVVRDAKGEVVGRGAIKDYYVSDDDSDSFISEDKKLVLPVPGLEAGCSIDVIVTREYPSAPDEFYFKRHFLVAGYPVFQSAVFLGGDDDKVVAVKLNDVVEMIEEEGSLWKNAAPYIYQWEPMQLRAERFAPAVVLGSSEASWEASAQDYLEMIEHQLEESKLVSDEALRLTETCKNDAEKFRAIIDWIRKSFTYKPLEFGRSASIPDDAETTASLRYGDCKDLSVLLKVMHEAVDIECHLTLVSTSSAIQQHIVTTDQFNHMIAYFPDIDGGLFVDPTDMNADAFLPVPMALEKSTALVLDPEKPKLVQLPAYPPDSSRCSVKHSVSIEVGEPVAIVDEVSLTGYYACWMRNALKERQKIKWVEWAQENLADYVNGLEVRTVEANHLLDPSETLNLKITYVLKNSSLVDTDKQTIAVPSVWISYYLDFQNIPDRKNPFKITYPLEMELSTRVILQPEYQLEGPLLDDDSSDNPYIKWAAEGPGRFSYALKAGEFDSSKYTDFHNMMSKAIKASDMELSILKK